MRNQELSKIFYEIAEFLEMDNVSFKPFAYRKAAESLNNLKDDVFDIYKNGGSKALMEIPGVGKNIADHIEEYLKIGKVKILEKYKKKLPVKMDELLRVEGMGPRKIKTLYEKLKIKNLKDLEKSAKAGKIAPLFGFGEKTEKNILQGIEFQKHNKGRMLLGEILPEAENILEKLKNLKEVDQINIAGSLRRRKETIGDVDILIVSRPTGRGSPDEAAKIIMDFFASLPEVKKVLAKGNTKTSIYTKAGFDVDLRVVPKESYGSALQYFTGSKEHNIAVRKIAIEKGLKLSEYGLFKNDKQIAGKTEEEIYNALNLQWIPPEIREDQGEIISSQNNNLPKLVEQKDIKGDLHCHSNWNGGENSIEEMAETAIKMGYEYIGISDHTKFLHIENGLDEKQILKQAEEIKKLNEKYKNKKFRILHGCEANILNDGFVDIKDEVLEKLDYVIAGIHSNLKMQKTEMTKRLTTAMKNKNIDIISHPTGRILNKREEYQLDFDKVLQTAKETGTILEINSSPQRLDLNSLNIRRAKEAGIKMIINTDAHQKEQLSQIKYGIFQACRGWAEKKDVVNTNSVEKLLSYFKK
jgi:DNA polymerase (family 10)